MNISYQNDCGDIIEDVIKDVAKPSKNDPEGVIVDEFVVGTVVKCKLGSQRFIINNVYMKSKKACCCKLYQNGGKVTILEEDLIWFGLSQRPATWVTS